MAVDNAIIVDKKTIDAITERVARAFEHTVFNAGAGVSDSYAELEASIMRKADMVEFWRLVKYCRSIELPMTEQEPQLDISYMNATVPKGHPPLVGIRISIIGKTHIVDYAHNNDLQRIPMSAIRIIRKSRTRGMHQLDVNGYDIRINLRLEESFAMCNFDAKILRTAPKTYRLKNRVTFLSRDGFFRYDMTRVNMSNGTASSIINSGITTTTPNYEVEVELLNADKTSDAAYIAKQLLGNVCMLMSVMCDTPSIVPYAESSAALQAYHALTKTAGKGFVTPQPISLSQQHLLSSADLPPNAKTILEGYTVTPKADGDRHILYVAPPLGKVFLLPRSMNASNVKYMGFKAPVWMNTVLDGELIQHPRMYTVFDAYIVAGKDVRGDPLWKHRIDKAKQVIDGLNDVSPFKIDMKIFEQGDGEDIFAACDKLLESSQVGDIPYEIDGLIFTHVGPLGKGPTFKWKPPEMNSVDFLIRFEELSKSKTIAGVYCRFKSVRDAVVSPMDYIHNNHKILSQTQQRFVAKRFLPAPTMTIVNDQQGRARCENGDIINDLSIVECYYVEDQWKPMKIRYDKVQEMQRSKRIAANDYNTALSVWKTIMKPITIDNITGRIPIEYVDDPDIYYDRDPIFKDAAAALRSFHNFWVKSCQMLGKAIVQVKGAVRLLDVGVGKANDLAKWVSLGIEDVLGVDISIDNIRNGNDGAYVRLMERKRKESQKMNYIFLALDASKPFAHLAGAEDACMSEEDKNVATILWSEASDKNTLDENKWAGFALEKFNVASLQFNLHYFCTSEKTLRTLCGTLADMLAPGGVVCGTCMDGSKVNKFFEENGDECQGKDANGTTLWMLRKKYKEYSTISNENYGKTVEVYFASINRVIDEYLVDMQEVTHVMLESGFRLPDPQLDAFNTHYGSFKDVYDEALNNTVQLAKFAKVPASISKSYLMSAKNMTIEEKRFSFLNVWFAFIRV